MRRGRCGARPERRRDRRRDPDPDRGDPPPLPSFGSVGQVQIRGRSWNETDAIAHEIGHALGLDHARAATACRRPFRPLECANRPRNLFEYGDALDVMGGGAEHFGAYPLAVLGLAPVLDAPAGRGVTALRPLEAPAPTLLRLRTAKKDWFVDTRRDDRERTTRNRVRAPRGAAISRVRARYDLARSLYPRTERIPATDPRVPCRAGSACLARQIFRPGRRLTVPGAFRLRVLGGSGPVRVATTWLDRTPPELSVARARILRPAGGAPELVLALRASATGAGVLRAEVDQGGSVTAVDADSVPGLVAGRRGRGIVRVPLGRAPVARVRLVDAAGNASAPFDVDLRAVPAEPAATVGWDPPLSPYRERPTVLAAGQVVTVRGRTDQALAGAFVDFEAIGSAAPSPAVQVGPDGTFSTTWTAPRHHDFILRVRVPVARAPNGIGYVMHVHEGHVRG